MLHQPKLLLLDEPTAGVDPKARRDFWQEIHEVAARGISVLVSTHYMDEAQRCHRLAYLAYGELLATGTPEEVRHARRLHTWEVSGPGLAELSPRLEALPAVSHATAFGDTLHVTGEDEAALQAAISGFLDRKDLAWRKAEPSLEDVFISLMSGAAPREP
jgi:ABC-2 type transport system ATP-binding protein